jgi:hypothetical protein
MPCAIAARSAFAGLLLMKPFLSMFLNMFLVWCRTCPGGGAHTRFTSRARWALLPVKVPSGKGRLINI